MPVFEYSFPTCQHRFEELVFGAEKVTCPQCDQPEPERYVSGFAVGSARTPELAPQPAPASAIGCGSCSPTEGAGSCDL